MPRSVHSFIGSRLIDVADDLQTYATENGYSLNIMDPSGWLGFVAYHHRDPVGWSWASAYRQHPRSIFADIEPKRLNIGTDANSIITSFSLG
jgi:hypothetical protein